MNNTLQSTLLLIVLWLFSPIAISVAQCATGETFNSYCYDDGEVDVVAFEFCPAAGQAAQSTILQGSFFSGIGDNLTVYEGASGSGIGGAIVFGPMGGNLAGEVISGTVADQCLIFVVNSNTLGVSLGCSDGTELELRVCSRSIVAPVTVSLVALPDLCINAGVQTNLSGGLPSGGIYSGPGVTDGGNGITYSFDPAMAGAGVHTLTYTVGANSANDSVFVDALGGVNFMTLADLCIDAGIQTGLVGGTPTGGVYSGPGVIDNGNGTYDFNPAIVGLGVHTITYTEPNGCLESAMDDVEVLAACGCPAGQTSHFYCFDNSETGLVAFEVCPSAGMAAQATINSATFATSFADGDNLTVYQGISGSGTTGNIVFGPMSGNLAGNVITGNLADNCLIFVVNSGPVGSCIDGGESPLSVCGESVPPSVSLLLSIDEICENAGTSTLSGGTPAGGVYSGTGVTDDGNGMTFTFDPSTLNGAIIITYTLGGGMNTDILTVFSPIGSFTALGDLCIDAGIQSGLGGGSPAGGTYSGSGVTDNGNGTYDFNPAIAGLGTHTITYTGPAPCSSVFTDDVEVLAACGCPAGQTTSFYCYGNSETNVVAFEICPSTGFGARATINQGTFATAFADGDDLTVYQGLSGSGTSGTIVFGPSSGNLSGTVITATEFDECLIFVVNSGPVGSCIDEQEMGLQVCGEDISIPTSFTALADLCENDGVQMGLSGGTPAGGVYSGPGVTDNGNGTYDFDPATAGAGTHILTYTVTDGNGMMNSAMDNVTVFAAPMAAFTAPADLCENSAVLTGLGGGMPRGGVYSGPGVMDDGNGDTYIFDPAMAGVGTHTIMYAVTNTDGCSDSTTDDIEVFALPMPTFTAPADLCVNAGVQNDLGGGAPAGGIYGGSGVTDNADGTYDFDPAMAGIGTHSITYTVTNGACMASASDDIEVFDLPMVSLSTALYYCLDAPIQGITITGGSPSGGVYSGAGVTDNGLGTGYFLDLAVAGTGTLTVTYTLMDGNGCSNMASSTIEIFDCEFEATDPCACLDNATVIDVDAGTGGDDGQFSELISVTDAAGGMLPTGQIWTVTAATGAFDAYNIPAMGVQSAGVAVATDGSVMMTHNAGLGTYELPFVHVDAQGYSITVEGPFGMGSPANQMITISNNCVYPNPVFDPVLADEYCPAQASVTLGGTDSNGVGADGVTFTIDGIAATVFDPGALAVGNHTVIMTFDGADDGNMGIAPMSGSASPGCVQTVQKVVEILAGNPPMITCPANNFGLPMGCNVTPPAAATTFNIAGVGTPDPALPTVAEGCGTLTLTSEDATSDNGCVRTVTRSYIITDQIGDADTCMQTFTFMVDTEDPTFDQALPMNATVECSEIPAPAVLTASDNCTMVSPVAFINEIHYDNVGGDVGEFVEIAGSAGFDLNNCELYLYNGSNNQTYGNMSLSGIIDDEGAGFGAVSFSYPSNGLQNGSPDGIAFVCNGVVVEFISYEGVITAADGPAMGMTSTDIGVSEGGGTAIGESLQLTGLAGCAASDFGWVGPLAESPGMINAGQNFDLTLCISSSSSMVTFTEVETPGACANEFTLTRTWTAVDNCGNDTEHIQVLTVEDTTPPVFCDAPMDAIIECDQPVPTAPVVTATDNCDVSGYTQLVWINEFHYDNVGADAGEFVEIAGIAGTSLANYTLALYNGANGNLDRTITLGGTIANESCNLGALSFPVTGLMNGSPDGMALVDGMGNVVEFLSWEGSFMANDGPAMGTMSTDVGVQETGTTPVGQSLQLSGTGFNASDFAWSGPAAESPGSINAGQIVQGNLIATLTETTAPGTCPQEMTITRTWDVMDACGNPSQHVQTINIVDTTDPIPVCRDITVELDANGQVMISPTQLDGGSTDNCSNNLNFSASQTTFTCADLNASCDGSVPVTLTVLDECGNDATCVANVFVQDNRAPIFSNCPGNLIFTLDPGDCQFIYDFDIMADDNCDMDVEVRQIAGPPSGTFLDHTTTTTYTFEAEDNCGNISVCSYTVRINEFPNPITSLGCNDGVQISLDETCTAIIGADLILEGGPYGCYDDYLVELFYDANLTQPIPTSPMITSSETGLTIWARVTDTDTGNNCWGSLDVEDKFLPALDCQPLTALCSDDLSPEALGFPLPAGATATANGDGTYNVVGFDACSDATLSFTDSEDPRSCQTINNVITRSWTIVDGSGNTTSCDQIISLTRATLADVITPPNFDGINSPALNCEDRCDDTDTRFCGPDNLYWNVLPAGHPYEGHPNPEAELWGCGAVKCFGTGTPSGASCGDINYTFTDTRINVCTAGPSDGCYKILRVWTILDWCTGEVLNHNQIIKVEDTEGPEINDVDDITISTDVWRCEADWFATTAWLQDNCSSAPLSYTVESSGGTVELTPDGRWLIRGLAPGVYTVNYIATDCCGNTTVKPIVLTVIDDVPPVVICDAHTVVSITTTGNINADNLGLTKIPAATFDDGSFDNCSSEIYFKAIRMNEFNSNGNTKNGEDVRLGDWASIDCDGANGDDDLRVFPPWYQGNQSYFDDYVKFCCADITDGPIMVVFRVYDIDPEPYTFGRQFPSLVPAGEDPDDYNGVLPEFQAVGGPLYGHYSDCMVEVEVQDKLPPFVVAPPDVTVTCDYWFPFDPDNPNDYTNEFDGIFGKVVTGPGAADPLNRDSINITDRVCPAHPNFAEFAPVSIFDDPCYDDTYDQFWGYDGYAIDNCGTELEQTIIPNLHCGRGSILRRWRASDPAGNWSNTATQRITIIDCKEWYVPKSCWRFTPKDVSECDLINVTPAGLGVCNNIFDPNRAGLNYLTKLIEWPCDVDITTCQGQGNGLDAFHPDNLAVTFEQDRRPRLDDDNCNLLAATYSDEVFTFVDGACLKIFRTWKVIDWCLYEDFQNGVYQGEWSWEWTQVIKLLNQTGPVFADCSDKTFCGYGDPDNPNNPQCVGIIELRPDISDDCTPLEDLRIDFKLDLDNNGAYDQLGYSDNYGNIYPFPNPNFLPVRRFAAEDANADGTYPVGTHRILWGAEDGCGNATVCEYLFTIEDCKPPTAYCKIGLSTIPMPPEAGAYVDIWAADFDLASIDNCTEQADLIFSFSDDINDRSRRLTCADAGSQLNYEVYVWDAAGNYAICLVGVVLNGCDGNSTYNISGTISNEEGQMVEEVMVSFDGTMNSTEIITDVTGIFDFLSQQAGQNVTITPEKDMNPRNGVTTFDLVTISKHILGIEALNSPYKMIAADVNKSGAITTLDMVELRKLILFIDNDFRSNTSWRFVDKNFIFPNATNPFETSFPEIYTINGLSQNEQADFVGIKIGDVNGSASPNSLISSNDRSNGEDLIFSIDDQTLTAGNEYRVDFLAKDFAAISGYQFSLNFNTSAVEFAGVETGALSKLTAGNFGTSLLDRGVLTTSWSSSRALSLDNEAVAFSVTFRAKKDVLLSNILSLSSDYTVAQAYNEDLEVMNVEIAFNSGASVSAPFELMQNQPNPFRNETVIGFNLPQASAATLTIYDGSGKVLRLIDGDYAKGYNEVSLNRSELSGSGVLYYTLATGTDNATKKMIVVE